jgi:hypothetical protein
LWVKWPTSPPKLGHLTHPLKAKYLNSLGLSLVRTVYMVGVGNTARGISPRKVVMANSFVATLQGQAVAYCNTHEVDPSEVTLDLFVSWVEKNPPAEVVTPKGEPRSATSLTGQVWAYLDSLVAGGKPFTRKAACDALKAAGLNEATVSTQYQRWAKTRGYKAPAPEVVALPPIIRKADPVQG